jgi:hypothetical protein
VHSKNKPAQTAAEAEHAERVASVACVVCNAPPPSEVHEPEQGLWFASVALCHACHRGSQGWHGTRERWTLRKMTIFKAINETIRRVAWLLRS